MNKIDKITKTYQILTNLSCNLDCTYCYEKKKEQYNNIEDIREYLLFLFERDKGTSDEIMIDYIGGESFMAMDLLEQVSEFVDSVAPDYGFTKIGYSISSNGTLLLNERVQKYILKYKDKIGIGISIDGTKEKHDLNRIYKVSRKGSYDDAIAGLTWLKSNICNCRISIKATYTRDTLDYYYDGVIALLQLGVKEVTANFIFEDVYDKEWGNKATLILMRIFDYIIDNDLENKFDFTHMLKDGIFIASTDVFLKKRKREIVDKNWCGSCSHMICLGFDKKVYGCNRFLTMDKPNMEIGYLEDNKIIPRHEELKEEVINQWQLIDQECLDCPIAKNCSACVAVPYERDVVDVKKTLSEKGQCGWTWAKVVACQYASTKLKNKLKNNEK
jgi:radical SAM protein with 4Fe4S-binding SPASM domain